MNDLVPTECYLFQNYPNPFKEQTVIKYCVAYKTRVRITIYNSDGEMVDNLVDEIKEAGAYKVGISISDHKKGDDQASGIPHQASGIKNLVSSSLFYQMKAGDYLSEKEMIIIKENMSVQSY
jgi:hypothetical protein